MLSVRLAYSKARKNKEVNNKMKNEYERSFNVAVIFNVEAPEKWHKIEQFLNENSKLIFVQKAPEGVKLTVKREVKKFDDNT